MSTKRVAIPGKKFYINENLREAKTDTLILSEEDKKKLREQNEEANRKKAEEEKENRIKLFSKKLEEFKNDNSYLQDYENISFQNPGVLIRLFIYEEPMNTDLILDESMFRTPTAYAKVIKGGKDSVYSQGDLVTISDSMTQWDENPEFLHLVEAYKKRPLPPGLPPLETVPQYIPRLREWLRYTYCLNKLYPTIEDKKTYFIPESFIISKIV